MTDIKSMTLAELKTDMAQLGEKGFRATQLYDWMHKKLARGFDEMTNLSAALREKCKQRYMYTALQAVQVQESAIDGTRKYLFALSDGNVVESVWMKYKHGNSGTYGEIFSSVLERSAKDFLGDFKIYRMNYQPPLRAGHFSNTMENYGGQHQVDAIFFGGVARDLPELIELLNAHNLNLPVYVSDDITLKDIPADTRLQFLYLPEAEVPVSEPQWLKLFTERYNAQPSYQAVLGAETMFALANKAEKAAYTPDGFVRTMDQAAKELNQKIKIKIIKFSSGKL